MSRNLAIVFLLTIIGLHAALGAWFASNTPYRTAGILLSQKRSPAPDIGAPDERQHANYVAHLIKEKDFPIFKPKDPNLGETLESHQPPLYYLAAAGWASARGMSDPASQDFGLWVRALNVVIGCFGVAGAFFVGWWGFQKFEVAVGMSAFYGFLPMMAAMSGTISNDPLLICLATWCLAFTVYGATEGWTTPVVIGLILFTGAAMLTKTTAVILLPTIFLSGLLSLNRKHGLKCATIAIIGATLLVSPWWFRNLTLYQDPLALKAFREAFTGTAQKSAFVGTNPDMAAEITYWTQWVGWWTARSFVGAFGYVDIWLNETGRANSDTPNSLYRVVLAVFALGILGWLAAIWKFEQSARKSSAILFVYGFLILLSFIGFNNTYFQAQGRYLLPAIAPISAAIITGYLFLSKKKWQIPLAVISCLLLGINVYTIGRLPAEFELRKQTSSSRP